MRGISGRAFRSRQWPNWAGGGVSGRMEGAGCVLLGARRSRGPCGRTRRRESRTSGRRNGGLSVRRVSAAFGGWKAGLHGVAPFHHGSGVGIAVPHIRGAPGMANPRPLFLRPVEHHPDTEIVRNILKPVWHVGGAEQYVADTDVGHPVLYPVTALA